MVKVNPQFRQQNLTKEMVDGVGEIEDQLWHLEPPIVKSGFGKKKKRLFLELALALPFANQRNPNRAIVRAGSLCRNTCKCVCH